MAVYRESILFVDEDELFCEGILKYFVSQKSFEVIDVATDWLETVSKTEKLLPDIVIMSIRVMHSDWINAARLIRARQPFTTIVVLSQSTRNSKEAVKAGVNAFIGRDITFTEILRIVGSVIEKSAFVFDDGADQAYGETAGEAKSGLVSPREKEILILLARGLQNKEIANRLSIRVPTVNNHLYSMYRKLGCSNRTEAVFEAVKKGVIDREG